ncbi:ribosome-associated ATPase/putative transporter RbbA [Aliiroseovarius sediminis]|uniref:ribosome-associated ATPase/putative transporter RbbA n=1 Tax=Aliiroseovarius sediminis TaxID=2925839 RepID=UPI001F595FA6|nr:ribosome-associated ATPase/putative transporter RbbA [Aliiroseovarius sediminis]MCI2394806.1 ribosome-associated ATPase/putative transporter RbbA [Aliiroseovarius sediminis]
MQTSCVARVQALSHRYGKNLAIDDVTLDLPTGKMLGLIGPDGVGKSTLLSLLAGVRKIQTGEVMVLDGDMADRNHREAVFINIAYMPQGLGKNLYQELSVQENLQFFGRLFGHDAAERRQRIDRLTKATGLDPFLDRPAGKLSGGMKQKLGLCCALIHDPDFLILDEPTTGVDPVARDQFWNLIDDIRADRPGMSVLVATAYMEEAERFDWLAAMDDGKILATASPDEMRRQAGVDTLEEAFVSLLPEAKQRKSAPVEMTPLDQAETGHAIVAKGLTKRFGDFTAASDVSFEIRHGEIFGFLGSNGSGKTTVMKMLTGLLPASEGEAWLFGEKVDASNAETRMRVGYMSQLFSLYGELTVRQNLKLHARLFDLPNDEIEPRIEELLTDLGLGRYEDSFAGELPLGLKQRLSLGCAVIHKPDILILDEPTSGVDPVARDEFFDLLADLSRGDGVTIFISTHFMNEGMRCDRISLMHAGQVLVYDTPQNLAAESASGTLNETFIDYITDAMGAPETAPEKLTGLGSDQASRNHSPRLVRLFAVSRRETLEVIRDPIRLAFGLLGSMLLMLLFAYGISTDVTGLTFAAYDQDRTPESRAYLANFQGSQYFNEAPAVTSDEELRRRMVAGEITLAIEIPSGFGRSVATLQPTSVAAWIDGANTIRASTIEGYVQGAHATFLSTRATAAGMSGMLQPKVNIEPRYRYNPSFESLPSMAASVPAILLMLFPAILMAVSISREREIGTITNFYVTPTSKLEYLLGKQLPYIGLGLINWMILTAMAVFMFDVPLKGSAPALALGAVAYVAASTGLGMMVAVFMRTQVAAVFTTVVVAMMPTVQFSGLIQPVSTLEGAGRILGQLWPTNYFMQMSVGVFNKALGFDQLGPNILLLLPFAPVFVAVAVLFMRKQEA